MRTILLAVLIGIGCMPPDDERTGERTTERAENNGCSAGSISTYWQ